MNDQEIIYPYNIIAISSKQEMGIKKNIGQVVLVELIDPISNSSSHRHVWQTVRIIIYEILRAKGKMHQRIAALSQFASLLRLAEALP